MCGVEWFLFRFLLLEADALDLIKRFDPWRSKLCTCPPKFTFNPYTGCDHKCVYCYVSSYIPRFFSCRPKRNLVSRLKRDAAHLNGELISIANSSDPYPRLEAENCLMRRCLEVLCQHNCRVQIITKSDIVVRDIDLLRKIPSMVSLTITTDNDAVAHVIEPNAPPPSRRLKAVETLIAKGIATSVRIDPIIPFVNEDAESLVKTLAVIGVKHVTASTYKVKHDNWQRVSLALQEKAEKLRKLYFVEGEKIGRYTYLPSQLRFKLLKTVADTAKKYGIKFGTCREGLSQLNTATCDGSWMLKTV
ncbi:MAG: SPL family radical SAM protein [Candidatus Bathyarchaeales archaeon]